MALIQRFQQDALARQATALVLDEVAGRSVTVQFSTNGLSAEDVERALTTLRLTQAFPAELCFLKEENLGVIPPRPSPTHEWDWPSLQWVLDFPKAKDEAWTKVKALRDQHEFGDFSWNEHVFDGDERAQQRLGMAALAAQDALARGAAWSVPWTLADNTVILLSASDVIEVMVALGENIKTAHAVARQTRAMIESAGTFEELISLRARWAV